MTRIDERVGESDGLAVLEAVVAHDLARLNYPPANWVPPREGPDGKPVLDVLAVGAGMCGQSVAFALTREGVRNIRLIDRQPESLEGPWGTYARMPTLRSPKHINGPDLGIPCLTYRAWHEARFGRDGWDTLYKIDRVAWRDYLLWVRRVVGLRTENGVELLSLTEAGSYLRATLRGPAGEETIHARKVVLASGRDGSGGARWPSFPSLTPGEGDAKGRVFHSFDDIPFETFKGGRIGILGAAATAIDNGCTALERGVAEAVLFARRPHMPQVNKSKGVSFTGFQRGYAALDDATRFRIYSYMFDVQSPPPHESVLRGEKLPGFEVRLGEGWTDVATDATGVTVTTTKGTHRFDAVIMGTGFDVNVARRPELAAFVDQIALWRHRLPGAAAPGANEAADYPYMGDGFRFVERTPGAAPRLADIHLFNYGSIVSQGALAGDIPGLAIGATRVAHAIVEDLFVADAARHEQAIYDHEDPELLPTRFFVPREKRTKT